MHSALYRSSIMGGLYIFYPRYTVYIHYLICIPYIHALYRSSLYGYMYTIHMWYVYHTYGGILGVDKALGQVPVFDNAICISCVYHTYGYFMDIRGFIGRVVDVFF